ncbi:MAG TPA: hypothetical protein VG096_09710 [Bryobacteraceae bacterium]|jgi:hypothetical protein|nr:hypothetical protein [Bryobacteraceae bacterium]
MIAVVLCLLAFALCYWAGKYSLGKGLVVLLFFGYLYGILRANLLVTASHFIFDAAVLGFYLSQLISAKARKTSSNSGALNFWVGILLLWPAIVLLLPFQPFLVSLVGFRSATIFLPMLILGARLREKDLVEICWGMVALNLMAGGFAAAEYFLSLPRFYPPSPVTRIIYASSDVAGGFFRIPATFVHAHAYGSTMALTLPFLLGFWSQLRNRYLRWLAVTGVLAALLGVLLSAARLCFLMAAISVIASLFTTRMSMGRRLTFLLMLVGLAGFTLGQERLQRFKGLTDTDFVAERIAGSVNRGFLEILAEYPMGNGLGGGGTSMPYFLEGEVRNPIGQENEYTMILAEQGVFGLLIWVAFIVWFFARAPIAFSKGPWDNTRRIGWCVAGAGVGTAWIGIGMLNSIPATVLLLLIMGWTVTPRAMENRPQPGKGVFHRFRYRPESVPTVS